MYFLGLIPVARFVSRKKYYNIFRNFINKLDFGKTCPRDIFIQKRLEAKIYPTVSTARVNEEEKYQYN